MMVRYLPYPFVCMLAAALAGCAGYQLGPTNGLSAGARSVQINPIVNKTSEPRLSEYVMNSLRKNVQQDGTYRLDTHGNGDIIVSGEIIAFVRSGLSYVPTDVITAVDYEVRVTVHLTARDRATGRVIFDRPVVSHLALQIGTDLPSAERQAIPALADDLAKRATALLVDGTW